MEINFNKWKDPEISDGKIAELYAQAKIRHKKRIWQRNTALATAAFVLIIVTGFMISKSRPRPIDIDELTTMLRQEKTAFEEIKNLSDSSRIAERLKEEKYENIF